MDHNICPGRKDQRVLVGIKIIMVTKIIIGIILIFLALFMVIGISMAVTLLMKILGNEDKETTE